MRASFLSTFPEGPPPSRHPLPRHFSASVKSDMQNLVDSFIFKATKIKFRTSFKLLRLFVVGISVFFFLYFSTLSKQLYHLQIALLIMNFGTISPVIFDFDILGSVPNENILSHT